MSALNISDFSKAIQAYRGKKSLFFFDFDGTLAPIRSNPDTVDLSDENKKLLQELCKNNLNQVVVVSGRDLEFLQKALSGLNVSISAEHGRFFLHARSKEIIDLAQHETLSGQKALSDFFTELTEAFPGTVIEKKKASLAFHYRNLENKSQEKNLLGRIKKDITHFAEEDKTLFGNKVIEVTEGSTSKGSFISMALKEFFKDSYSLIFAAGDDVTDETMFKAIAPLGGISMHVSSQETHFESSAQYQIDSQDQITEVLGILLRNAN